MVILSKAKDLTNYEACDDSRGPSHSLGMTRFMKRQYFVFFSVLCLVFSSCATQQQAPLVNAAKPQLKRITQLDVTTNLPVKSWNARSDTIHQHVTPPVGITFVDADTGKEVHFEGTYKIESYLEPAPTPNESSASEKKRAPPR